MQQSPRALFHATATLCSMLSPLLRMIDYGLTWRRMEPGEILVREGDPCDRLCVVLHGRLREVADSSSHAENSGPFTVDSSTPACAVAGGRHMIVGQEEEEDEEDGLGNRSRGQMGGAGDRTVSSDGRSGGSSNIVEEYGRGSCVGESEVLAGAKHSSTICAIRETEVVEMSRELFHIVANSCPEVFQHVTQNLSVKFMEKNRRDGSSRNHIKRSNGMDQQISRDNIATIALLPITDHAPVSYLVQALSRSLEQSVSVATVSSSRIQDDLGLKGSELFGDSRGGSNNGEEEANETQKIQHDRFTMMSYLSQLEEMHGIVVYECDNGPSEWTSTCLRQADVVLLVGHASDPHEVTDYEKWAIQHMLYAQNVLILVHDMDWVEKELAKERLRCTAVENEKLEFFSGYRPRNTRQWITSRTNRSTTKQKREQQQQHNTGVQHHLHIRIYKDDSVNGDDFDARSPFSDVARLARWLMGTQTGLTLGGGGARGLAHVGVYEAMVESGVPVDVVGGTSQGAFIGALIAMIHNPMHPNETRKELIRLSRKYFLPIFIFCVLYVILLGPSSESISSLYLNRYICIGNVFQLGKNKGFNISNNVLF